MAEEAIEIATIKQDARHEPNSRTQGVHKCTAGGGGEGRAEKGSKHNTTTVIPTMSTLLAQLKSRACDIHGASPVYHSKRTSVSTNPASQRPCRSVVRPLSRKTTTHASHYAPCSDGWLHKDPRELVGAEMKICLLYE